LTINTEEYSFQIIRKAILDPKIPEFRGQIFTKSNLYDLGKDVEGNRQQPKAIVDMLIFYGYVIKRAITIVIDIFCD